MDGCSDEFNVKFIERHVSDYRRFTIKLGESIDAIWRPRVFQGRLSYKLLRKPVRTADGQW